MTKIQNDLFYTASILEYTARVTKNKRSDVAELVGIRGIQLILDFAKVSHCLPFAQVADELIEDYNIPVGTYAPEEMYEKVPGACDIGKVYMRLVEDVQPDPQKYAEELWTVFRSRISEWMTQYNSAFYYSPRDYVLESYREMQSNAAKSLQREE